MKRHRFDLSLIFSQDLSPLFFTDPVVASLAQDIFKELAQIEGCQGPMQMRLIPTLVSIMQAPPDKIPTGLCAVSRQGSQKNTKMYRKWQVAQK